MSSGIIKTFFDKVLHLPSETDSIADIKTNFTTLNRDEIAKIFTVNNINFNDYDGIISINTSANSGLSAIIASMNDKQHYILNPKTGLDIFGNKLSYTKKYLIWLDKLEYDETVLEGLDRIKYRGYRIQQILTLINMHDNMTEYVTTLFPEKEKSLFDLYDLLSAYENNGSITKFLVEKCKFRIDYKRKLMNRYTENYVKNNSESFDYMKSPTKYYCNNYYVFHNPENKFSKLALNFLYKTTWDNVKRLITVYGDMVNNIFITPEYIDGLDTTVLLELQNKFNFNVIEFNPNNNILENRVNQLHTNFKFTLTTKYDAVNLNLYINDKKDLENDITYLKLILSMTTQKVFLNLYVRNIDNLYMLQDLLIYTNEYCNSAIQGIIIDYNNFITLGGNISKKLKLHQLCPIFLNAESISDNVTKFYNDNNCSCLLTNISILPVEISSSVGKIKTGLLDKLTTQVSSSTISKCLRDDYNEDDDTDKQSLLNIKNMITNHKYALSSTVKKDNKQSIQAEGFVLSWYNYFSSFFLFNAEKK